MPSRYVIGIDLGTSNCAIAYLDTRQEPGHTRVLLIPQLETESTRIESQTLPSFLYLPPSPSSTDRLDFQTDPQAESQIVGAFARNQSVLQPGRVIHSAKSWLCHPGVDREERFLPWASDEVPAEKLLSPVEVSARYLSYLRQVWDGTLGAGDAQSHFDRQEVTLTVPASFDESAQFLTLEAASIAGFPKKTRLLEEPQAAFYFWLEHHPLSLAGSLPNPRDRPQCVLVCDLGGGTTDFSLFEITPPGPRRSLPSIRRIAVSDHILLGGDNIDLTLAHRLEETMKTEGARLSPRQWLSLVCLVRELKERILQTEGGAGETFHLTLPAEGAGLFRALLSAAIRRGEVEALVLDGFFPLCEAEDRPRAAHRGLKEWGLPFATDTAITRHLAGFLAGRKVDAVLFTGGSLKPPFLQRRLLEQITHWQGHPPLQLVNEEMDLAVARGAAYYGAALRPASQSAAQPRTKIRGGYPHALFVELYREDPGTPPSLVCLLPKGSETGDKLKIRDLDFKLLVDRPVRFQLYYSNRRSGDRAGDIVRWRSEDFHPLPALQTRLTLKPGMSPPADGMLDIALETLISETGLLQLYCVHAPEGGRRERWQLDFNLRKTNSSGARPEEPEAAGAGVAAERLRAASDRIALFYGKHKPAELSETPKNLKRELEKILGMPREEWNIALLRALWPALAPGVTRRVRSAAHEITFLYLAGYLLRPGYGADLDPFRIDDLWRAFKAGCAFAKNTHAMTQWWILWRRVAGGLGASRQKEIAERILPLMRPRAEPQPEVILLAGALERWDLATKQELAQHLLRYLRDQSSPSHEPHLWALGRLASRFPLYAGPESIVPASVVEQWVDAALSVDLGSRPPASLNLFLSQACRLTSDRARGISAATRQAALGVMESSDATGEQKCSLLQARDEDLSEQARIFGEELPSGLKLA